MAEVSLNFAYHNDSINAFEATVFVVRGGEIVAGEGFSISGHGTSAIRQLHVHAGDGEEYVAVITRAGSGEESSRYSGTELVRLVAGNTVAAPPSHIKAQPDLFDCGTALQNAERICGSRGIASF